MTKRLVISMVTLVALVALALAIPFALTIRADQRAQFVGGLERDALATATIMASQPFVDWQATADATAERTGARVVVVDRERTLVADSDESGVDRTFDRPEISSALDGYLASDVRNSSTLGTDLRYVAAPIIQNYSVVAAVRLSLSEDQVDSVVFTATLWLIAFFASVATVAAIVAWLLARSIARPVDQLTKVVESLPTDLSIRADETSGTKEVRSASVALNTTADRLEGLISRTQRVAADASHHLRSPLTGVRLRLEAISDLSTDPEIVNNAESAISEVDRLAHRIDQILLLTRADSGTVEIQREELDAIVVDRAEAASVIAQEHGVDIVVTTQPCSVAVPTGTCARIIDELLGNAMAYAVSKIYVSVKPVDGFAELVVSDDGPGLPEDTDPESIFNRFFRAKNSVPGGSGLGLALVRESARLASGNARAEASNSGGLQISVRLPLTKE